MHPRVTTINDEAKEVLISWKVRRPSNDNIYSVAAVPYRYSSSLTKKDAFVFEMYAFDVKSNLIFNQVSFLEYNFFEHKQVHQSQIQIKY